MRQEKGFTILELMIVVAVLGILAAVAMPSLNDYMDKRRAVNAAESIYSQLVYARSEAISRSRAVAVVINPAAWALGIIENPAGTPPCDPTVTSAATANACVLNVNGTSVLTRIDGNDYAGVTIDTGTNPNLKTITFDPVRGTVLPGQNGKIKVFFGGFEFRVVIGPIGRTKICVNTESTASTVGGYAKCTD